MKKDEEHKLYNKNLIDAWKNAISGIIYGIKSQRNIRIQIIIAILVIIACIILKLELVECIILCFASFFVIVAEMINTAIEAAVDLTTTEYNEKAKKAKDAAAGAVALASINSVVVAVLLLLHKIF